MPGIHQPHQGNTHGPEDAEANQQDLHHLANLDVDAARHETDARQEYSQPGRRFYEYLSVLLSEGRSA